MRNPNCPYGYYSNTHRFYRGYADALMSVLAELNKGVSPEKLKKDIEKQLVKADKIIATTKNP